MGVQVIPIPTEVVSHSLPFPFPILCLFPFPWDSHGIPGPIGTPIPMHISSSELITVLGSQPEDNRRHKSGGRLPLISARSAVTFHSSRQGLTRQTSNFPEWV